MPLNLAIVHELAGTAAHFNRTWCYPSQDTLLERLRSKHGQTISLRTLNRHLAALVAAGYLRRIHRHRHDTARGWTFRSTLYVLLAPVWQLVRKFAKAVQLAARWTRMPQVTNKVTPTGYTSPGGAPAALPPTAKRTPPAGVLDSIKAALLKK